MIGDELTERQKALLACMVTFRFLNGFWPKIRDIGASMVPPITSPNGVVCQLTSLEKKGWIRRHKFSSYTSVYEVVKP